MSGRRDISARVGRRRARAVGVLALVACVVVVVSVLSSTTATRGTGPAALGEGPSDQRLARVRPRAEPAAPSNGDGSSTAPPTSEVSILTVTVFLGEEERVASARVRLTPTADVRPGATVDSIERIADSEGRCVVELPAASAATEYRVWAASKDGEWAAERPRAAGPGDDVAIHLVAAHRIEGRVHGAAIADISTARVLATCPTWPEYPRRRVIPVRSDGTFTLEGVVRFASMVAVAPGRVPSPYARVEPSARGAEPVVLELGVRAEERRVRLVVSGGVPLTDAGAFVRSGQAGSVWAPTDGDGWLRLAVAPGEDAQLDVDPVRAHSTGRWLTAPFSATVTATDLLSSPVLEVPKAIRPAFTVRDASGTPILGLDLELRSVGRRAADVVRVGAAPSGQTGADGTFAPTGPALPEGSYELIACSSYSIWTGALTAASSTATEVRLDDFDCIRARLIDARDRPARASNVWVGIVAQSAPKSAPSLGSPGPGFVSFRGRTDAVLLSPRRSDDERVVRVAVGATGCEDVPMPATGECIIRVSEITATVTIEDVTIEQAGTARVEMKRAGGGRSVFYVDVHPGDASLEIHAVPPGEYVAAVVDIPSADRDVIPIDRSVSEGESISLRLAH